MTHVRPLLSKADKGQTLKHYRKQQMKELRWKHVKKGVSKRDLEDNFEFLNGAVLNRSAGKNSKGKEDLLLTTTGLFGPIRTGTRVHFDLDADNLVVTSELAPDHNEPTLIHTLNQLHANRTGLPPEKGNYLEVNGFWSAAVDGAGIGGLDHSANVFGSTGQLICVEDELKFPLLKYGVSESENIAFSETLAYYGGTVIPPKQEFTLGFTSDLWGIQYDQKLPDYISKYQFGPTKGGGLFVEHHPFPHIWLPAKGKDPQWHNKTTSRIILGRRVDSSMEDGYFRTVEIQKYHFTMFEIPVDGSALAVRPQCIHNDSFSEGAQTVWLGNTPANTVALRHSAPIDKMEAGGVKVKNLEK